MHLESKILIFYYVKTDFHAARHFLVFLPGVPISVEFMLVWRYFYDVGNVKSKYCISTFPISTVTIMFMCIMWLNLNEYHLCNCFVEINSIQGSIIRQVDAADG